MIKAILFDLDGTLLPMNEDEFINKYFDLLTSRMAKYGYDKEKLAKSIWLGTKAMYENDGKNTNEDVFWNKIVTIYGESILKDKDKFDEFYLNEFKETKSCCKENKLAREIIDFCKDNVEFVILATNPLFPRAGTLTRMSFIDLKEDDFDLVTTYEDQYFLKPNPKYFINILEKFNLKPEEVIMFGNNNLEDALCSKQVGIKCYLVDGYIINNPHVEETFEIIKMEEVISKIKENLK